MGRALLDTENLMITQTAILMILLIALYSPTTHDKTDAKECENLM